ncbi:MAG: GNAT family N-acetyltransferase [Gammaproteobacteria bacterium]|nr:GNAT family N-acetyltransferase [Gammaproteobacteria bacterium]
MDIRPYEEARDLNAVKRIWYEIGWIEDAEQAKYLKDILRVGRSLVAMIDDEAECLVHTVPGKIRCIDEDLAMCAVTAVTTSRRARKKGFAQALTARQLASGARDGAEIAVLGIFEQGFYDLLGFGTGSYEHQISFDPATLLVDRSFRTPVRLTKANWREIHGAMMRRVRAHGGCVLAPPEIVKADLAWTEHGFGLGYYDGEDLSHFFWCDARGENGPYEIVAMAYRSGDELLELLALIKAFGDQVSSVLLMEPPEVQLQTLLKQPIRNRRNTKASKHENVHRSVAWWQLRVLNVAACVAKRRWHGPEVRFNLSLTDPVEPFLEEDNWRGVGGDYVVTFAESSCATPGTEAHLPLMSASVNAFSRLLFGIVSASSATLTDGVTAPNDLLVALDAALVSPSAKLTWDF